MDEKENPLNEERATVADTNQPAANENQSSTVTELNSKNGGTTSADQTVVQNKQRSKTSIVVIILLVFVALGIGLFVYLQSNSTNQTQNSQAELGEIDMLTIGSTEGPASEIFPTGSNAGVNSLVNVQIYEGLVEDRNGSYEPLLAESWTNPDQLTWVFKLKPNIQFHTGKTMTAEDVKASLESLNELEYWSIYTTTIESVEVTGDLQVTIRTATPDPLLLNRLSKAYIYDSLAKVEPGLDGTGGFTLDSSGVNDENTASLVSFDAYHQGSPKTKKLAFKLYDDNAAMYTAFNENQFDILDRGAGSLNGSGVDESLYERLDFTAPGSFGMYLNLIKEDSPLNNQKVREAITYAIDRTALLEKLENPEFIVTSQMVPRSLAGYDGELSERQPDNEKVKNLLAEAGYPDGVELSFLYFEGVQDEPPILIEQLELAGFTIEAVPAKTGEEMFTGVESKEYDIFTSSFISDINDARDVFGSVSTKENPIFAMVDDPVFNELLTASDNEFDPIARTKALQKANQYIYNNVLWIPLRNSQYTTYYPKNVVVEALSTTDTNSIKFWKSGRISN